MKNKFLLLTLLLSNNILFSAQGGAPAEKRIKLSDNGAAAVDQQGQEPSLKQLCFKNIIDILNKEDSDPIKMDICEYMDTGKVPQCLIDEFKSHITQTTALLWVKDDDGYASPFQLLEYHRPDLAHLVTQNRIPWKLSIQDLIDAGGSQKLKSKDGILSNLSLTSLKGLKNIDLSSLQELRLSYNQITTIEPDAFDGLTALQKLNLNNNKITTIEPGAFNGLSSLQELHLTNNNIITIVPGAFSGLTALQELNLNDNEITTIVPDTFNGLAALRYLYLNKNQITTLEKDALNGLTALTWLDLNNNKITTIEPGAFNGLAALRWLWLHLEGNQITIKPGAFDGLSEELRTELKKQFKI